MINRAHRLSVVRQCRLLAVARAAVFYKRRQESEDNIEMMRLIDEGIYSNRFMDPDGCAIGLRHTVIRSIASESSA
jgi:hypothetical protein